MKLTYLQSHISQMCMQSMLCFEGENVIFKIEGETKQFHKDTNEIPIRRGDVVSILERSLPWVGHPTSSLLYKLHRASVCLNQRVESFLSACVVSHSCCLSKVSVMTIRKPEQFNSSCSKRLMRQLDVNTCGFMLSATLFNIFSCLFPWVRGPLQCPDHQHLDLLRAEQRLSQQSHQNKKPWSGVVGITVCL